MIGNLAVSLAVAGRSWDAVAIKQLLDELMQMDPRDTAKRKGFMIMWSGPKWIQGLQEAIHMSQFIKASELIGEFLTSAVAERCAFHNLCSALKDPSMKVHGIARYSVIHLARACAVARSLIRGDGRNELESLSSETWLTHLRGMHEKSTVQIFDMLGVNTYEDALAMRDTVHEVARRTWSSAVARQFGSLSLLDLPCQACEFNGILGAVFGVHGGGHDGAIRWLLAHLSGDMRVLKTMGKLLKFDRARQEGRGDGLDRQAASVVTTAWLAGKPNQPLESLQRVLTDSGWDKFKLPRIICPRCSSFMSGPLMGRKRKECATCYAVRIRGKDAARQAKKRHVSVPLR